MIPTLLASILADDSLPKSPPSDDFWMPTNASTFAENVDGLYNFLYWLSVISCVGIFIVIAFFIVKYKAGDRGQNEVGDNTSHHNTALEITWSVIPLFIVIFIFVWGFKGFVEMRTPPKDTLEIHALAKKWNWTFTYPGGVSKPNLHVPIGKDVRIILQSNDVLHSLYIPAFRTKMDVVPGRYTDMWFNATKPGEYPIFCAEYCGTSHSDMLAKAFVHEAGGYEKWLTEVSDFKGTPVEQGALVYNERGCKTCHSTDGSKLVGPSWKGIWGTDRKFADGSTGKVDENYIADSINNPSGKIVEGFAPSMPTYQGQLTDKEINGVVEYIKSLK
jgi:cytochrome c oxidase subunit 2